jgi:hypothetical protein
MAQLTIDKLKGFDIPLNISRKNNYSPASRSVVLYNDAVNLHGAIELVATDVINKLTPGQTPEAIRDTVAAFIKAGSNITVTHNDWIDELVISARDSIYTGSGVIPTNTTASVAGLFSIDTHGDSGKFINLGGVTGTTMNRYGISISDSSVNLGNIFGNTGNGNLLITPVYTQLANNNDGLLLFNSGGGVLTLAGTFTISNAPTNGGIKYDADYSATFTARSLVDKAYVDATASGLPLATEQGSLVMFNGVNWQAVYPRVASFTNISGTFIHLNHIPVQFAPIQVFRNGVYQMPVEDFTLSGSDVTFTIPYNTTDKIIINYYI